MASEPITLADLELPPDGVIYASPADPDSNELLFLGHVSAHEANRRIVADQDMTDGAGRPYDHLDTVRHQWVVFDRHMPDCDEDDAEDCYCVEHRGSYDLDWYIHPATADTAGVVAITTGHAHPTQAAGRIGTLVVLADGPIGSTCGACGQELQQTAVVTPS